LPIKEDAMNTVLFLALTSLPGADPVPPGGMCACKADTSVPATSVTPVPAKQEKQPLFPRLSAFFGKNRLFHKEETPPATPSQFNLNPYNNFRPETVIPPEPTITTFPSSQPMLLPQGPGIMPAPQAPLLTPTVPAPAPRITPTAPTTAEPPLN
jgi:hypothetical protein